MKVGDLVKYRELLEPRRTNDTDMTSGIVVGFDRDHDPIVYFICRKDAAAYYQDDIEVLNESW